MSSFDRPAFLIRANREKEAADRAACIEARIAHQKLSKIYYELAEVAQPIGLSPAQRVQQER